MYLSKFYMCLSIFFLEDCWSFCFCCWTEVALMVENNIFASRWLCGNLQTALKVTFFCKYWWTFVTLDETEVWTKIVHWVKVLDAWVRCVLGNIISKITSTLCAETAGKVRGADVRRAGAVVRQPWWRPVASPPSFGPSSFLTSSKKSRRDEDTFII